MQRSFHWIFFLLFVVGWSGLHCAAPTNPRSEEPPHRDRRATQDSVSSVDPETEPPIHQDKKRPAQEPQILPDEPTDSLTPDANTTETETPDSNAPDPNPTEPEPRDSTQPETSMDSQPEYLVELSPEEQQREPTIDARPPQDSIPDLPEPSTEATPEPSNETTPEPAPSSPLRLYMAPNGKDTNSGRSPQQSVLTTKRIHDILLKQKPQRDVEIRIAPGNYYGQTVSWTYTMAQHTIRFMPLKNDKNRPIFDGCLKANPTQVAKECPGGTWLTLRHSAGQRTRLHFEYIHIRRYQTALSFNGNRTKTTTFNSHNRIYGCYFERIGNVFNPKLKASTAAVRLVNSKYNIIRNNHFINVVNLSSGSLIHAIYAAHMSDFNQITRNRFKTSTGDPVRIRDFSNNNIIDQNTFTKMGKHAGYTDWFCNRDIRNDCTKATPECPSWENQFRNNTLDGNYACKTLRTWQLLVSGSPKGCKPPKPKAKRVYTSGNKQTPKPCSK